jgi:hypothetical protein
MAVNRRAFVGLLVLASTGLWLLMAGPNRLLGLDLGSLGVALLIAATWGALFAVAKLPAHGIENEISPGEWRAWIALAFTAVIAVYSIAHAPVFQGPPLWRNPDANRVGRNIALLVIAWAVLSRVLATRWDGRIQQDERDREIESKANGWARTSLSVFAIGIAVLLGFTPTERLAWAPPPMIAHLLVIGLIMSCLVDYAYTAIAYWRDRH